MKWWDMKQLLLICVLLSFSGLAVAQSESDIQKLNRNRQFLATTDLANPYVDTPPFYPGGGDKWNKYVSGSSIITAAIEKATSEKAEPGKYTIVVKFMVNTDSTVSDVTTVNRAVGYGLEEAAIQLVKESGKWIPANISGVSTKAYVKLPVRVTLYAFREGR
jgi:hypothetical protein